jgi:hypothetical protein
LVRLLLTYGANPQTLNHRPCDSWEKPGAIAGNVFDNFAVKLSFPVSTYKLSSAAMIRNNNLVHLVASADGEFSKPQALPRGNSQHFWCETFSEECDALRGFPEQVDCEL